MHLHLSWDKNAQTPWQDPVLQIHDPFRENLPINMGRGRRVEVDLQPGGVTFECSLQLNVIALSWFHRRWKEF